MTKSTVPAQAQIRDHLSNTCCLKTKEVVTKTTKIAANFNSRIIAFLRLVWLFFWPPFNENLTLKGTKMCVHYTKVGIWVTNE